MRRVLVFLVPALTLALTIAFLLGSNSKTISASTDDRAALAAFKPVSSQAVKFAVSPPLSSLVSARSPQTKFDPKQVRKEDDKQIPSFEIPGAVHDTDASFAKFLDTPMPAPLLSFDGMNNIDNGLNHGILVLPPDTNGDIGPNHYVQSMNILLRVFDKNGNALTPPFKMSSLFASLGTQCSTRDDGEPTVLYDPLADRWLMSQYCNLTPPFRQMIAVSKTGDPTGSYYVYEFLMPNFKQNDVTKFGVWPNAYFASCDLFLGSDYKGAGLFAFNRAKLLAGDPTATFIYFEFPSTFTTRIGGLLSADMDGLNPPPANVSGLFMGYMASEYGDRQDALRIFEFRPDFGRPTESTFQELLTSPVVVEPFDPTSPPGRNDIFQPPPGEMIDSNSDRLMYRVSYRNFGTRESLVVNQTVRVTPLNQQYHAGVRLYELSRPDPNSPFTPNVQSTIGVSGENRFIGSAAQDHQGNLAVGYNTADFTRKPGIFYSGRLATDPPGTLRTETELITGSGVQTAFGFRWGDYTNMTVDPSDDCTFWYNNQYFTEASQNQSPFGWVTRIGKFKFPECTAAPRGTIQGQATNAVTGLPVQNILIEANTIFTRSTDAQGNYSALLLPGTYTMKASAHGYIPQTVTVPLANGATVIQNFALQPRAILETEGINIVSESCAVNSALEPGETVTINLPLKNTGAAGLTDVTVTLQPGGGVTSPSGPQNYGALPPGGPAISRPFTFTVSPTHQCGANITFNFQFTDTSSAGSFLMSTGTGFPRYVLNEPFAGPAGPLPDGWTTSFTGESELWQKALIEPTQQDFAAFSPESVHSGVNELVTPPIAVTGANGILNFRNKYDLESTFLRNLLYDGTVLEIKIGGGAFQDILAAGGTFAAGGYDGPIASGFSNPLQGRMAWASRSGLTTEPEWVNARVLLPPSAAGQNIQLRWRLATDIGGRRLGHWIDNIQLQDGFSCSCSSVPFPPLFDFDGDGKTDLSVFHPSNVPANSDFEYYRSSTGTVQGVSWGETGDLPANADYDGDLRSDIAVFRPSNAAWYIMNSSNGTVSIVTFGLSGDKLAPGDFDGDGKFDIAVFRPSNGVWYVIKSSSGQFLISQFGLDGDVPVQADYDGDGKADIAVWRPGTGVWYVLRSSDSGFTIAPFGQTGDIPVAGEYDGDGKADFVIFRPSTGVWYLQKTQAGFAIVQFGLAGDRPLQGDFEGDGKDDIAVYRPDTSVWYYLRSSNGAFVANQFGSAGDAPVPAAYVP